MTTCHRAGVRRSTLWMSKDTAPSPDKVKHSDMKNLSEDDKSELFTLCQESFATRHISEEWSLMERIMARELAQDLERRAQGWESHSGQRSQIRLPCLRMTPEERTNSGRCVQ